MSMQEEKTRWQYLSGEAEAGRLYLDPSVAKSCRDACNRQIDLYSTLRNDLKIMSRVTGLGRFDCSEALAEMLGAKAIGGDGDVDTALKEHIEVVTLIRDTIQKSVDKLEAQDESYSKLFKN
ncbi:hypothetical protein ACQPZ2_25425 [Nocardia pseudovaccinii]|uniref:hypothetical protein n=1 Tax=Nocardia pseudovaccinii TaxID=189540 RepID=UPI003D9429BA